MALPPGPEASAKRPTKITMLCLALGWLCIVGVGNSYLLLTDRFAGLPVYLGGFMAVYSVCALAAGIGLWRMKTWGLVALRTWMLVSLSMAFALIPALRVFGLGEKAALLGFTALVAILFWFLNRYVTSQVSAARPLTFRRTGSS